MLETPPVIKKVMKRTPQQLIIGDLTPQSILKVKEAIKRSPSPVISRMRPRQLTGILLAIYKHSLL